MDTLLMKLFISLRCSQKCSSILIYWETLLLIGVAHCGRTFFIMSLIGMFSGRHSTPASSLPFMTELFAPSFCVSSNLRYLFCLSLVCPDKVETFFSIWHGPQQAALDFLALCSISWGSLLENTCSASSGRPAIAAPAPALHAKLALVGAHFPYGLCVQSNGVASDPPGTRDSWSSSAWGSHYAWSCLSRRCWESTASTVGGRPPAFLFDSGIVSTFLCRTGGWMSRPHYTRFFFLSSVSWVRLLKILSRSEPKAAEARPMRLVTSLSSDQSLLIELPRYLNSQTFLGCAGPTLFDWGSWLSSTSRIISVFSTFNFSPSRLNVAPWCCIP